MILIHLFGLLFYYNISVYATALPWRTSSFIPNFNNSLLSFQFPKANTSILALEHARTSTLDDDIVDLTYPIPHAHPPRQLQISYNKRAPISHTATDNVLSTVLGRVHHHVSRYGDGPLFPNPFQYSVEGCYSTTIAIPRMRATVMTFGMLKEVIMALRTIFERQGAYYNVFYELTEVNDIPWADGSLLREPELLMLRRLSISRQQELEFKS